MKKVYKFIYKEGELNEANKIINKYKKLYDNILNKYTKLHNNVTNCQEEIKLMREFRIQVINLLEQVLADYKYFNNNAVVYLTGSYARECVRLFSDVDLNIVYVNGSGKKYMKYEELFYYIVSKVLNKPRYTVHSIITAFNDEENIEYIKNKMDNQMIKVILESNDNKIEYMIPKLYKKRYYLQYMNNKNYKIIFNNLIKIFDEKGIQEWSNNFLFLNQNIKVNNYYEYYINYIFNTIDKNELIKKCDYLINYNFMRTDDLINICQIKQIVQMDELHFIYNSITVLQLINILKENNKKYYNSLYDVLNNCTGNIKKVSEMFFEYNYKLVQLNILFGKYHLDYSIHCDEIIDMNKYPQIKKKFDDIIIFKNIINKKIIKILKEEVKYD